MGNSTHTPPLLPFNPKLRILSAMTNYKTFWKEKIAAVIAELAPSADLAALVPELPPSPDMGDIGFPMFALSKTLRKAPPLIARDVAEAVSVQLAAEGDAVQSSVVKAVGSYVNVFLNRGEVSAAFLDETLDPMIPAARGGSLKGARVIVEFSSPNTNKPLHLGHLRNDALGMSISRILEACGAEVRKVSIINDRGIHICKSMLAYMKYGEGKTPESENIKSDHFVGNWYVRYSQMEKENPTVEEEARELLRKWEAGDSETVALWKKMNSWALEGMKETYQRTGIEFDTYYFESDTYLVGKAEVLKGLEKGLFYREEDGSVWADLTNDGLDKKLLLRKDGTSVYMTQDFGLAIMRHGDWNFDRLVYVVGNEQRYHFQVLFLLLKRLGYEWSRNLYHLSYGMVNLPEGKMKSREGTVVDADDLVDSLRGMVLEEMADKDRTGALSNAEDVAEKVAMGAIHYYLLQSSPFRDMMFNPKESLSFNGNTGPYLQYSCARISSMLTKLDAEGGGGAAAKGQVKPELLASDVEWELVKSASGCADAVESAAAAMDPSVLTTWLYETAKRFNRFYHECPILNATGVDGAPAPDLAATRLALCRAVLRVMRDTMRLVCIPFIESM